MGVKIMQKMKSSYLETDPVVLMTREKNYNIHKQKLAVVEKTIDNSSPFSVRFPRMNSKSPFRNQELELDNSRIYYKLNKIYHRPAQMVQQEVSSRNSKSLKRTNDSSKICLENEVIHKRLNNQKPTFSVKDMQKQFKEMSEIKEMISKFNRAVSSKKLISTFKANNSFNRENRT